MALCAVSGILVSLSFPPHGHAGLIGFGLAPAFYALMRGPHGAALLGGLLFAVVEEALLLRWFIPVFGGFAPVPFLIYAAWYVVLFGLSSRVLRQCGPFAPLFALPVLWVAVEYVRSELFLIRFAWFGLAHSQSANLPVLQAASVVGEYGLSFVIAFVNAAIAWCTSRGAVASCIAWATLAVASVIMHVASARIPAPPAGAFHVLGVQGEGLRLDELISASEVGLRALPKARLVVWPEYACMRKIDRDSAEVGHVTAFASQSGVPVLFGAPCVTSPPKPHVFENTVLLVGVEGVLGAQVKSEPIPFFADGLPAKERAPLLVGGAKIGTAICYDMDFPYVSRELVKKGAQVLVFPTMDASAWGEVQHLQHASMAPLRAVEHRRWVVRVASSGISEIVDPYGRVRASTPLGGLAILPARVALLDERTPYDAFGWLFAPCCLAVAAFLLLVASVRERAGQARTPA